MAGQTLFSTIYHFDDTGGLVARAIDGDAATITITQASVVVIGPVAAVVAPHGAATSHILSYVLADPLPDGIVTGDADVRFDWAEGGVAQFSESTRTIAGGEAPDLSSPLTITWLKGNQWVTGDTHPPATLQLLANGESVPLLAASAIRFMSRGQFVSSPTVDSLAQIVTGQSGQVMYEWQPDDISQPGPNLCQVRVTWNDDKITTFPSAGYGEYDATEQIA